MKTLEQLGEDGLIQLFQLAGLSSPENLSFSDDVAVVSGFVVSTDSLLEDVHFRRATTSAKDLGYKALAVSLSDLAAKGAAPVGCLLSWSLPKNLEVTWVEDFIAGFSSLAKSAECTVLGGDTTASHDGIYLSVTVIGSAANPKLRSTAQVNDVIAVTGTLGDSAAGLELLDTEKAAEPYLKMVEKHRRPTPRLAEGQWLASLKSVTAMMDLSDGLLTDLPRLMKASLKSAIVETDRVPISSDLLSFATSAKSAVEKFSVVGGEDYELLLTVKEDSFDKVKKEFMAEFNLPLTAVGKVTVGGPVNWNTSVDLKSLKPYSHF